MAWGLYLTCLLAALQLRAQPPVLPIGSRPNILFIILDDVGKDQLAAFNPAAPTGPMTPVLNAVVAAGVKFTNFYTTPECSPSRVAFFTGRYPLRTGVDAAILDLDLPAAQISPYEITTPKVLATAGYRSALLGKYHLSVPDNNPDGIEAPIVLGWDLFKGNMNSGPSGIDVTLGGQYTKDVTKYASGFPLGKQTGAAWFLVAGKPKCDENNGAGYTGQQAVTLGGIPALDTLGAFAPKCSAAAGSGPDFTSQNGYYVWNEITANSAGVQTQTARQYIVSAQTDAAIDWIKAQKQGPAPVRPWMATVSYTAIHTPYQQPPAELYPPGFVWPANIPEDPSNIAAQHVLGQLMLAAVDKEIGRLLVNIGLATLDAQGKLVYNPAATNTMVVIAGDNGTYFPSVYPPYSALRSKGSPYETGVTTPLIVAGPLVAAPGRSVTHLVNCVDLFRLFAEIAGVNVRSVVPASHLLDSEPVLPYLTNPNQQSFREYNFSQLGSGLKAPSSKTWPCVLSIGPVKLGADNIFTTQSYCELNGGEWYGPTAVQPVPLFPTSCAIQQAGLYKIFSIGSNKSWALRNDKYKLLKFERAPCDADKGEYEFYDLTPNPTTNPAGIELPEGDLLTKGQPVNLTADQLANFGKLAFALQAVIKSEPACYGDGNLDKRVGIEDLLGVWRLQGLPSVFDFNADGVTGGEDFRSVLANFGNRCLQHGPGVPPE